MLLNNLGYPRIGARRELKKACELYWSGKSSREELYQAAKSLRENYWKTQADAGIDLDHVQVEFRLDLGLRFEGLQQVLCL